MNRSHRDGRAGGGRSAADGLLVAGLFTLGVTAVVVVGLLVSGGNHHPATPTTSTAPLLAAHAASPVATRAATRPRVAASAPGPIVCLDPGHGGADLGTVREADGTVPAMYEKALTLRTALDLASRLRADGFRVVLTRTTDTLVNASDADVNGDGTVGPGGISDPLDDLQARINICNAAHADLLISMHFDGSSETDLRGPEVWYTQDRSFGDKSQRFATLLDQALFRNMQAVGYTGPNRGVINDITDNNVSGRFPHMVISGPAVPGYVTPSAMPGVIGEPLFLSNDADASFVNSKAGYNAVVTAYEQAVLAYFGRSSSAPAATP